MFKRIRHFGFWITLLVCLGMFLGPAHTTRADVLVQPSTPQEMAHALLQRLSPEERVGQLFLVTFKGTDVGQKSQIYDLIVNQHIGGVALSAENDNFTDSETIIQDTKLLTQQLQSAKWDAIQNSSTGGVPDSTSSGLYIPLFVALSQEGDGYPNDQILSGLTPLPTEMAIGATWDTNLATQVGEVLGQELEQVGVNLLLGPSLDVLEANYKEGGNSLGTRTFGGDPYWVGVMGRSYIEGIHKGGDGRLAVVAKYFPGRGGSDRLPEDEVATVRKSLEQLKQIELAPFLVVTGGPQNPLTNTDGLLVSHIRYQGFQGNIRATTRPVSFDPQALSQLMGLPQFQEWRGADGVIVSDMLGSRAVRQFYDPTQTNFDARLVARDAFLAGNDLLYLNNFIATNDADERTTILRTLAFFAQKYREDPAFAQRVDTSAERILTLKYRLYDTFIPLTVLPTERAADKMVDASTITFDVARQAATLISPAATELDTVLPKPPQSRERIIFITDVRKAKQCSRCAETSVLPVDALQNAVIRLYGPQGGKQVYVGQLSSYSFYELQKMLDDDQEVAALEADLQRADWIVFAMQDVNKAVPESSVMTRFLNERPDLIRNKRVIAFAFNAPYFLDATNISKLTAYYGLFSKTPAFIEVAVRILFQELTPKGDLPISVPGVGYDLITATSPDPAQVIPLFLDLPGISQPTPAASGTPEPTVIPTFKVGDTIPIRTGIILDHNQKQVPDNTVVRFVTTVNREGVGSSTKQIEANTVQGIARATIRIEQDGLLQVRVVSEPANTSEIISLDISKAESAAITVIAPTPIPSETTVGDATAPTATPAPTAGSGHTAYPTIPEWFLIVLLIGGISVIALRLGQSWASTQWGLRWALTTGIGGLLAYNYMALGMPGSQVIATSSGLLGILGVCVLGLLIGFGAGFLWKFLTD